MAKISLSRIAWFGVVSIIAGFVGGIGYDLWTGFRQLLSPQISILSVSIPLHWYIFGALVVIGFLLIMYDHFRSTTFKAAVVERRSYRIGETICFKARFAGTLDKGAFLAEVLHHSGITLPGEKAQVKSVWWSCDKTYGNPTGSGREGTLSGEGPWEEEWCKPIPSNFPIGKYDVVFSVKEGKLTEGRQVARAEDSFLVGPSENVREGQLESTKQSAVVRLIDTKHAKVEDVKGKGFDNVVIDERGVGTEIRKVEGEDTSEEVSSEKNRRRDKDQTEKDWR